jgi:threonine dehydrogenase-like Zn-dependent dehydrogenase
MRAVIFDNSLHFRNNFPMPQPAEDEVLIKVHACGVCNTDLEIIKGYGHFSGVLGHEFCGRVESPGPFQYKRVTGEINISCRKCGSCLAGHSNHCPHRQVLGIDGKDGAMADYVTLPTYNLHILPEEITAEEAIFIEPLAAALEIVEQVPISPTLKIVVLGDGKLGILCSMALKLHGPHVVLAGKHESKLAIAQQAGIDTVYASDMNTMSDIDLVVEATGSPTGLESALSLVKPRGIILLKTTTSSQSCIDLTPLVVNEVTLIGSRCGPFDKAIAVLAQKQIDVRPLITAQYPPEHALEAFAHASEKESLKIVLTF